MINFILGFILGILTVKFFFFWSAKQICKNNTRIRKGEKQ